MNAMSDIILSIRNLKTYFSTDIGDVRAVDDVSLDVPKGKAVALVGESGSGKSVTALSIIRLVPEPAGKIVGGEILFQGRDLLTMSTAEMREIRGNDISMIFQEPMTSLNPVFRIGNQIAAAIRLHRGVDWDEARRQTIGLLDRVGIPKPEERIDDFPHQFSGGMRQRAMIAMALACDPVLLIADEPTTALDVTIQAQILDLMKKLQVEEHLSVLLITHDLGIVAQFADSVAIMKDGKIVERGDVRTIYKEPKERYTIDLLSAVPKLDLEPTPVEEEDGTDMVLLKVENLSKYFPVKRGILSRTVGEVRAVDDVSFSIPVGETLSLVGESGSGKTTTGRAILRLIEPTAGSVKFDGIEVTELERKELRELRRRIQVIFQDPYGSLNPRMTVYSMLAEILKVHNLRPRNQRRDRVYELLSTVGLSSDSADRYPNEFSGGQRQRIGIARALAVEPDLIVADEAVSALDVTIQAQILRLLEDLQDRLGLTYLFISHDLAVTQNISDYVAVMQNGKIVEQGPTQKIFRHPTHPYTQSLLAAVPIADPDK
jgi:peptide/nickel transport system ATP-binding protein